MGSPRSLTSVPRELRGGNEPGPSVAGGLFKVNAMNHALKVEESKLRSVRAARSSLVAGPVTERPGR
jgi:hypothetical protein